MSLAMAKHGREVLMNKSLVKWVSVVGFGAAALAMSGSAEADVPATCPAQQVIFLFDQSSSMLDDGVTAGRPKWQEGLDRALVDLQSVQVGDQISVIGFGNTGSFDNNYYHAAMTLDQVQIKTAQNSATFTAALSSAAAPSIQYATPLAAGACDALNEIWTYNPLCSFTTKRVVFIYSDGLENSTPDGSSPDAPKHFCYGPTGTAVFNEALAGQGFGLERDTWQWNLANFAYGGNVKPASDFDPPPLDIPEYRPVWNARLLFDNFGNLASHRPGPEGTPALSPDLQDNIDANGVALFKGIAKVSFGSYAESKLNPDGTPTKIPHVGDTDPSPTRSCVENADLNRVITAMGRKVRNGDPVFSGQDLAARDVNHDLVINILDYQLVITNYGKCS